jgi:Myotubularin-like phosphatase domain
MEDSIRQTRKIDLPFSVYIPGHLTHEEHLKCAYSRTNGRFPALTYYNKFHDFAIWRGSELNFDPSSRRSNDDEMFIKALNKGNESLSNST